MKRLLVFVLALLLLTGCAENSPETAAPETTAPETLAPPTEPPVPWIEAVGEPWNEDGSLLEIPLTIPDGLHYMNALAFCGNLLLWSVDDHLADTYTVELCLVDLTVGAVTAQVEYSFVDFVIPQVVEEYVYLCSGEGGAIVELDRNLEVLEIWWFEPVEGNLTMGAHRTLYRNNWEGTVTVRELDTGEERSLMAEDIYIEYFMVHGNTASLSYYDPVTGEGRMALLDLATGAILEPGEDREFSDLYWQDGTWLCEVYGDSLVYYVGDGSGEYLRADLGYDSLRLLDGSTLLHSLEDGSYICLHDLSGKSIAKTQLTSNPYRYYNPVLIPSESFGGYFLLVGEEGTVQRLLYWDVDKSAPGEDIVFEPIPTPEEAELRIAQRVQALEQTYGLNILVGCDAGTNFYDFNAEQVTDWELVDEALDTLENALMRYPEGFFRQLRYGDIHRTEIHLVGNLSATTAEYTDTYEAFVQDNYNAHVMVADISLTDESTYFHEFSHIIDSFLEWDAMNREDALFSEDTWYSLNPDWFPGYTYDYSWTRYVEDYSCFVDDYSTINPTEDRARVLEYAMVDYGAWTFEGCETLLQKLDYYCLCIRDAFDTTGWPETVLWEQYLP